MNIGLELQSQSEGTGWLLWYRVKINFKRQSERNDHRRHVLVACYVDANK